MKKLMSIMFAAALVLGTMGSVTQAAEPTKELTRAEVKSLIQSAKTHDDHLQLAAYYRGEATKLEADANDHVEMGAAYEKNKMGYSAKFPTMDNHCKTWAKMNRESAKSAAKMAEMHEEMAKNAK